MSENQQLIPADIVGGELTPEGTLNAMVAGGDYLPRFQLFGSKSDACAEGRIGIGHYGLVKDDKITDLGEEVNVVLVGWRPKAVQSGDDFIICYKPDIVDGEITNPIFKKIVDLSFTRDSGCMYGPEYLLWVPDANAFATYHLNSKTGRREARNFEPLHSQAATLKARLITQGKYKWHGPVIIPCSAPIDPPDPEKVRAEWTKFQNPPETEVEVADEDEERAR